MASGNGCGNVARKSRMGTGGSLLLVFLTICMDFTVGLVCYRCDSLNHGPSCDSIPATRHLRNYGEEEPCLHYEDVNNQYLALQKDIDSDWYSSPVNGDHGLPVHLLLEDPTGGNASSLSLIHADRDLACLYVRSTFHHTFDNNIDPRDPLEEPPHIVYFRKCVQLPSLDMYPICRDASIYKGQIEMCVCRTDKCNFKLIENPHRPMPPNSPDSKDIIVQEGPHGSAFMVDDHKNSAISIQHKACFILFLCICILDLFQ